MLNLIKRPLITEKNTILSENNVFVFEVDKKATKLQIKKAVEKAFRVQVDSVNTAICRNRSRRTRVSTSRVRYWKKAMVKLKPGEKIAIFEGV